MSKRYVVVDIETTGLSKHFHKITEIAAVELCDGHIGRNFNSLVNPGVRIPRFITSLTGIDNELVKDAPKISDVMPGFLEFLGSDILVAHNATFDHGFLNKNSQEHLGTPLQNNALCTRRLSKRLLPDLPSTRLGVILEHLSIPNSQAHRAMGDAMATAHLLNHLTSILEERGIKEMDEIIKFSKMPIAKASAILRCKV
jgi:DNA polymerase-3 subunit alpha (Gram-positive type)